MIVVTGASGDLGQKISEKLVKLLPKGDVTFTSRTVEKLKPLAEKGYATTAFNFDNIASMEKALQNVETLLLISGDAPNEQRIIQQKNAINAAVKSGVKHIVYTSFINPTSHSLFPFAASHEATEQAIIDSGLTYTILRNPMYAENLAGALQHSAATGNLSVPGSAGKTSYLLKDDIAEITANVLASHPQENNTFDLTGNTALTLSDIADIASQLWNKKITASKLPEEAFNQMLQGYGLPEYLITALQGLHQAINAGEYSAVNDQAATLLKRQPQDINTLIKALG